MGDLEIVSAFVLPLLLLVAVWLGHWGNRYLRLALTLLLPLFYIWHWQALQAQKGWPVSEPIPERFRLVAADIVESHQAAEAAIYLWLQQDETSPPRAYRLPYTREMHRMLHEVRQKNQSGERQVGVIRSDDGMGRGVSVGDGRRLEFEAAPRTSLPPKH